MYQRMRFATFFFTAACLLPGVLAAQPVGTQLLKDVWVATSGDLYQLHFGSANGPQCSFADCAELKNDTASDARALTFGLPNLGGDGSARDLVVADGTKLLVLADGMNLDNYFDTSGAPSYLTSVNTVTMVVDDVSICPTRAAAFSGYSKRKRTFELWEYCPANGSVVLKATGTPQMVDMVYVSPDDVAAGSPFFGGAAVGAVGRSVVLFRKKPSSSANDPYEEMTTLFDAKQLPIKNNTSFLSADRLADTDTLVMATSDRRILTVSLGPGGAIGNVASYAIPDIAGRDCGRIRNQLLRVRYVGGTTQSVVVSDVCGQALRYDLWDPQTNMPASGFNAPVTTVVASADSGLTALAVGEGNQITCESNEDCQLAYGFSANIARTTTLVALQYIVCDKRVQNANCQPGEVTDDGVLSLNSLLPQEIQDTLEAKMVHMDLNPDKFGAGPDGKFGMLLVQADSVGETAAWTGQLDIQALLGFELGVDENPLRPTGLTTLLNQDTGAYAPDNPAYPTVEGYNGNYPPALSAPDGFDATTATIGDLGTRSRGFSLSVYGLQQDLYPPGPRDPVSGGLPTSPANYYDVPANLLDPVTGQPRRPPMCNLTLGSQSFVATAEPTHYFINLVACLFSDEEQLLRNVIVNEAFVVPTDRANLLARLDITKDKLIKWLNATSGASSAGVQNADSVLQQLDLFDQAVAATPFCDPMVCSTTKDYKIYKNELEARSEVFRFHLDTRALRSVPLNGFPQ